MHYNFVNIGNYKTSAIITKIGILVKLKINNINI